MLVVSASRDNIGRYGKEGSILIYKRDSNGSITLPALKISPPKDSWEDYYEFGTRIAVSKDFIAVGASGRTDRWGKTSTSRTYIYSSNEPNKVIKILNGINGRRRFYPPLVIFDADNDIIDAESSKEIFVHKYSNRQGKHDWSLHQKIKPPSDQHFYWKVATSHDCMALTTSRSTEVSMYRKNSDGYWIEEQKLTIPRTDFGKLIPWSLALHDWKLYVLVRMVDATLGASFLKVIVYSRNSRKSWQFLNELQVKKDSTDNEFRDIKVAMYNNTMVVCDAYAVDTRGECYLYILVEESNSWKRKETLRTTDGVSGDYLGRPIAFDERTIFLGSVDRRWGAGAVYVYDIVNYNQRAIIPTTPTATSKSLTTITKEISCKTNIPSSLIVVVAILSLLLIAVTSVLIVWYVRSNSGNASNILLQPVQTVNDRQDGGKV